MFGKLKVVAYHIKMWLLSSPIKRLAGSRHVKGDGRVIFSFAMQRSGQHVIIDWICRGYPRAAHFNHCLKRKTGLGESVVPMGYSKYKLYSESGIVDKRLDFKSVECNTIFYSFENWDLNDVLLDSLSDRFDTTNIIIVRDAFNWLASTVRHNTFKGADLRSRIDVLKCYYKEAIRVQEDESGRFVVVKYNDFISDSDYRKRIATRLGMDDYEIAEEALGIVPPEGGGSSFSGRKKPSQEALFNRWRKFVDDEEYRVLIRDPELLELNANLFGGLEFVREATSVFAASVSASWVE